MKLNITNLLIVIGAVLLTAAGSLAQSNTEPKSSNDMPDCPMMKKGNSGSAMSMSECPMMKKDAAKAGTGMSNMNHDQMVMKNGEKAMGFSQTATTHHFLLMADGGAIQVEANDPNDSVNRDAIRRHLTEIAKQFADGIFTTPFAVHGKVPDGVPTMDKLRADIAYSYEETPNGARVRIKTKNPDALAAIYEFLRFQIDEHHTGDPLEPGK